MVQVLCRRRKNNPLLVGEPGVGKTALAEGLALRIHQGDGARAAQGGTRLRAGPRRAGRRHPLPRRLRGARQAGARRALQADARDPVHRRDPHAGRRRLGLRRHDGRRQPAEAGARLGRAALHRLDHVRRREAVVRQGPRAVAPLPEDRSAGAVGVRDARDPEGPARGLRAASRGRLRGRGAGGRGHAVGAPPARSAPARQGDRRARRGRRLRQAGARAGGADRRARR